MDTPNSDFVGVLAAFVTGGGVASVLAYLKDRQKLTATGTASERTQLTKHYDALVARLETRIQLLETTHQKCMDEHLRATRELGDLQGRLGEMREMIQRLQRSNTRRLDNEDSTVPPQRPAG
jgi:chromosome segregation ATPase